MSIQLSEQQTAILREGLCDGFTDPAGKRKWYFQGGPAGRAMRGLFAHGFMEPTAYAEGKLSAWTTAKGAAWLRAEQGRPT